jgi:hypothetical protein
MSAQAVISTPRKSGALRIYWIEMLPHPTMPIRSLVSLMREASA